MPKPPQLPMLPWSSIFETGVKYSEWIQSGESPANRERMEELRKAQAITPMDEAWLLALANDVYVVAVAEDWCGDVVRHVPVLAKMEEIAPRLRVRYVTRDRHPEMFARFLTNGGEAIPKFVFLNREFTETGNWGPMPEDCRRIIARGKACSDVGTARQLVKLRYEADPERQAVVKELIDLIGIAATSAL